MEKSHNLYNVTVSHEDLRTLYREDVLNKQQYCSALQLSGVMPGSLQWSNFIQILLSSLGTLFLVLGITFFFAYNWDAMSKWQKFGGIQAFIIIAVTFAWIKGPEKLSGKLGTLVAGSLIGVLMAVYGQIYQTGADPYELFMYWAILLLPLVIAARFPAFWLMWLVIVNIAITLYVEQELGGGSYTQYTPHFLITVNFIFLGIWNTLQLKNIQWMQGPWISWAVAIVCLITVTILATISIDNIANSWKSAYINNTLNTIYYLIVTSSFLVYYQFVKKDLFILALAILSVCILTFALYAELRGYHSFSGNDRLFFPIILLIEAGLATFWLRRLHIKWSIKP